MTKGKLYFVFKCSCIRTLIHSGMLHDVAEPCDVETKLEQATDNLSNSQENFVEGRQVRF